MDHLDFRLPPNLEAAEPPEARGIGRDQVRLMISKIATHHIAHAQFWQLPEFLRPGDLLVINTSATMNAAIPVRYQNHLSIELHLSTQLQAGLWVIELRQILDGESQPFFEAQPGDVLDLPETGKATLLLPYRPDQRLLGGDPRVRLWIVDLSVPGELQAYLGRNGHPIRYKYVHKSWPLKDYQTVYATEPGSAEMPSAGRAFTPDLITRLVASGIQVAPLVLHTGVASLESHEPSYAEIYRLPAETANIVNMTHRSGGRVIAVGTTTVRALESASGEDGRVYPTNGWTSLVITPDRGLRVVDGLLTGFHEPRSTHLMMLAALAGDIHLCRTYTSALSHGYLWHEFGDLHLLLP